jgi:hypothetical protein
MGVMTAIPVPAAEGRRVHIGPHDIFRRDLVPVHKDTTEADVLVDRVIAHGRIAVLMWRDGTTRGAVVYDRDDYIEAAA